MIQIRKAERRKAKLRLALAGVSGAGKTYSALLLAKGLGGKVCVIDTESRSADLYANEFDYDVCELAPPYTPKRYIEAINGIEKAGYDVIVIDSLSHAWAGEGGALDMQQDAIRAQKGSKNSYTAWRDVTPEHNKLVNAVLQSSCHVITTMRSKIHHDLQSNEDGRKVPVKIGLAPVQREGMEYEFTVVLDVSQDHYASSSKDRTRLFDGKNFIITEKTGEDLLNWLNFGKDEEAELEANALTQKEYFKGLIEAAENNLALQLHFGAAWKELGKLNNKYALAARDDLRELYNKRKEEVPPPEPEPDCPMSSQEVTP